MIGLSVLCIGIIFFNAGIISAAQWDYEHIEQTWPKQCFDGKHQSPIPLSEDTAEGANFAPFFFNGYDAIYPAVIKNNGHTVEITLDVSMKPTLSGGGLNGEYVLHALHFHWEAEHTIDGVRYPLELHLVHYDKRAKDLTHALDFNGVTVLGVLYYVSPDDDTDFEPVFSTIQQILQQKVRTNVPIAIPRLELDDFLPRDRAGFYRYQGSLTTPNCTEGITWTVFTNGLPISQRQLRPFTKLLGTNNKPIVSNYRPLQDLNERRVLLKQSYMSGGDNLISSSTVKMLMFLSTLVLML